MTVETPKPIERKVRDFNSCVEFISHLRDNFRDATPPEFRSPWVFRGHGDANWELKPAAWREDGQKKLTPLMAYLRPQVIKGLEAHYKGYTEDVRNKMLTKSLQVAAELAAVRQFCNLADELGMHIPEAEDVPSDEDLVQSAFNSSRFALSFGVIPFTLAQHHGVPTRFLDWTRSPLIAAFFAAEMAHESKSDYLCVWATKTDNKRNERTDWITVARSIHPYLHAQQGLFSIPGYADMYYDRLEHWPAFDQEAFTFSCLPALEIHKLTLHVKHAEELQRELLSVGRISRAHLMPTFDNVANAVKHQWAWYSNPTT